MTIQDKHEFEEVLKEAEGQCLTKYHDTVPDKVFELLKFADDKECRSRIVAFIREGYKSLHRVVDEYKPINENDYELINYVMVATLAWLSSHFPEEKDLADLVYKEFIYASAEERFYELNIESGTLAIVLSLIGYKGDRTKIYEAISHWNEVYDDEEFVVRMRYALWVIEQDKVGVAAYFKDSSHKRNLAYVAATFADLNMKESLPELKERLVHITNPVAKEAFLEAIVRLEKQDAAPLPHNRMIHLFGIKSSTEIALGDETDNQFIIRAEENSGDKELSKVHEVDESSKEDVKK